MFTLPDLGIRLSLTYFAGSWGGVSLRRGSSCALKQPDADNRDLVVVECEHDVVKNKFGFHTILGSLSSQGKVDG